MTTKTNGIVAQVSKAIIDRKLPPGTKLNERELADAFKVSRTLARQALDRLQQDGLVNISPKRSTIVAKPTIEDAHHLFEAIGLIESAVVELLVKTATDIQIGMLKKHVSQERQEAANGNIDQANDLARDFHELFVSFINNPILTKAHSRLIRQQSLITALFRTDFDYSSLQNDHYSIVEMIERRDSESAKRIMALHYKLVIRGYHFKDGDSKDVDLREIFRFGES